MKNQILTLVASAMALATSAALAETTPTPSASPSARQGQLYTCPMHPEIVQIGPGACPICGMALEPMDVLAEADPDPEYESMRLRFWVSTALSLPALVLSMASMNSFSLVTHRR